MTLERKPTTRGAFDRDLQRLQAELLSLGSMVEGALVDAVAVLARRDHGGSQRLIAWDRHVNERRFAIENDILTLIARQQPVAGDMRVLAAGLEIATELERVGDYAKGIARINLRLDADFDHEPYIATLGEMARGASAMIQRALEAYAWRDVALARRIPQDDAAVDAGYQAVHRALISYAARYATTSAADNANTMLWAAHNLERAADRAVNICERVIFMVTGTMEELSGA